jgi:hypothetical protein
MKHVLYIFLICICVTSSIANGKKYALESAPVEVVESEGADCDDKDPPLFDSLDTIFYLSFDFRFPGTLVNPQFTYPSNFVSAIELDYFCPPPNYFRPAITQG